MAELVVRNLEALVDELSDFERVGLFTKQEIRAIASKRRTFEYGINKRVAKKQDFLEYIQYEINLDCLQRRRRKTLGIRLDPKRKSNFTTVRHIHQLFQLATKKFKADVNLWIQHAQYCHKEGSHRKLSQVYGSALQYHPRNSGLWIAAAKAEFEVNKNVSAARNVMLKGLRLNPESKYLWWEYFRFEMLYVDKIRKRRRVLQPDEVDPDEDASDAILNYKAALIVFENALKTITDDPKFCLKFLTICQLFEETESVQENIYHILETTFSHSEDALDCMSRQPLSTLMYSASQRKTEPSSSDILKAEGDCVAKYHEAVERLSTLAMWDFGLEFCFERLEQSTSTSAEARNETKRLQRTFDFLDEASREQKLSERFSLNRIDLCMRIGSPDRAKHFAIEATRVHKNSVWAWHKCLTIHCQFFSSEKGVIFQLFEAAVESVSTEASLPVWLLWAEYCRAHVPEEIERVYVRSCEQHKVVGDAMKLAYVDWALVTCGLPKVREVYQSLLSVRPVPLALYKHCIELENLQDPFDSQTLRTLYREATDEYGKSSPDLWIDYVRFELLSSEKPAEVVPLIQWRAIKTLNGDLVSDFVGKCACLGLQTHQ
ncbi:U3 small nucleolar RNA-associated protein 6 homolog isoform X2 [Oscarella lobularis]|uniref:U3 small nucleolar RNA-associated protein 6 homolog isoform X2 n=1 Tax=Oscarella lobularis TaxID=121494 RepID=UPI0033134167